MRGYTDCCVVMQSVYPLSTHVGNLSPANFFPCVHLYTVGKLKGLVSGLEESLTLVAILVGRCELNVLVNVCCYLHENSLLWTTPM